MNHTIAKALWLVACFAATALGCSDSHPGSQPIPMQQMGAVGMSLSLPQGLSLASVQWVVHNPALLPADRTGSVDVSQSSTVEFVVGGLPAGAGYSLTLTATTAGGIPCQGSATFTVSANTTATVSASIVCVNTAVDAGPLGSVSIGGIVAISNVCAAVTSLSASPSSVDVGGVIQLAAQGVDGGGNSADVGFVWAVTGGPGVGSLDDASSAAPEFTCTAPGPVTVTVTASVADGGAQCADNTASVSLNCTTSTAPSAGSLFVIDSTNRLFSFDSSGNLLGSIAVPSPIGNINGGGMTLAAGSLYITTGQPTNEVSSYELTLVPQALPASAFSGLSVPRGIAFDPDDGEFYVDNGAATVNVYGAAGASVAVTGGFPGFYGPSGVAYDPDDQTIWVANYVGAPAASPPLHGVAEYTASGAVAQTINYASSFVVPTAHVEPYSITVCPAATTGGKGTVVVVGFIDDGSGLGTGVVQSYTTAGTTLAPPFGGLTNKPYALSCTSGGEVYVADITGLYLMNILDQNQSLPGPFTGLTPPLYGVLAASAAPTGGSTVCSTDTDCTGGQ